MWEVRVALLCATELAVLAFAAAALLQATLECALLLDRRLVNLGMLRV